MDPRVTSTADAAPGTTHPPPGAAAILASTTVDSSCLAWGGGGGCCCIRGIIQLSSFLCLATFAWYCVLRSSVFAHSRFYAVFHCMNTLLVNLSTADGCLGWIQYLSALNKATANVLGQSFGAHSCTILWSTYLGMNTGPQHQCVNKFCRCCQFSKAIVPIPMAFSLLYTFHYNWDHPFWWCWWYCLVFFICIPEN